MHYIIRGNYPRYSSQTGAGSPYRFLRRPQLAGIVGFFATLSMTARHAVTLTLLSR